MSIIILRIIKYPYVESHIKVIIPENIMNKIFIKDFSGI